MESTNDSKLTIDLVILHRDIEEYSKEWNGLLEASEANNIFLTWEWISAWLESVHRNGRLFSIAVRSKDGSLVALAPFYISDFRLLGLVPIPCIRPIGDCHCGAEYPDIIIRKGFEGAAVKAISKVIRFKAKTWGTAWLPKIAGWTGGFQRLEKTFEPDARFCRRRKVQFSTIRLPKTFEEYQGMLSGSFRSNVRRQINRLNKSHRISVLRCESLEDIPQFLECLFELHRKRWESVGQAGSFERRPPMKRFYKSFAEIGFMRGWVQIFALKVDDTIGAVQFGYVYDGVFLQMQEGFDPEGPHGMGNALRYWVIRWCIENGIKEYDFLGGYTEHKRHWAARPREGYDVFVGSKQLKRNWVLGLREIWPTGRFIKEGFPANQGKSHN